jgi:hypothetical protein
MTRAPYLRMLLVAPCLLVAAGSPVENARKEIVAAYQQSLDALRRGDVDAAMQMDTKDWVSITVGQKPRTRQEIEPFIRRDIAGMKPPPGWNASWSSDFERGGTSSGIQIYELKLEANSAIVLCLVGSTQRESVDGEQHNVWRGSHVRDTWINMNGVWKRRLHEKLTVNELMIDGRPAR